MSALTAVHTLTPRPLATLGQPRRHALGSAKLNYLNRINGVTSSTPLKRSFVYNSDEENVDPTLKIDNVKRKRTVDDDGQLSESPKSLKTSHTASATVESKPFVISTPRKVNVTIGKPAGRSPQAKSIKAFGRRSHRDTLAVNSLQAPSYASGKIVVKPSRQVTQPAGWFFDIHVDTPEEEATNTMQHFTGRLDISDDESGIKTDDRGKENIPPHELGIEMPATAQTLVSTPHSRRNMTAPSRSPLNELKASEYHAPDLQGIFHTVVVDDESTKPAACNSETSASSEAVTPDFANTAVNFPQAAVSGSALEKVTEVMNTAS